MYYYETKNTKPWLNLALEEYLFRQQREETVFLLWQNEPTVVVGKNQNTADEINEPYVQHHGIHVIRRITGGGAVYHDLGNVNFSLIGPAKGLTIDFQTINKPVLHALQGWGVPCELSGRNDLVVEGKKFSGIAQYRQSGRVLNHGTLLYDTDVSVLSKALQVKKEKLSHKGVASVKSRVTNLKPYLPQVHDVHEFIGSLRQAIFALQSEEVKPLELSEQDRQAIRSLAMEKYTSFQWNYGRSPKYNLRLARKFPAAYIEAFIELQGDVVKEMCLMGDFFGTEDIESLEDALVGKRWQKEEIAQALAKVGSLQPYFGTISSEDLLDWWFHG